MPKGLGLLKRLKQHSLGSPLPHGRKASSHLYDFSGTPFEVGEKHARTFAREIRRELKPLLGWFASKEGISAEAASKLLVARYEGLFRERFPAVLEEVHGIAEGAGLAYEPAFVAALGDMMSEGCTAISCGGGPSGPFIAQTKDSWAPTNRFRIMRFEYSSGRRMVLLNYPGWLANTGITSNGLAFAAFSIGARPPEKITAPGSFLKRLILEATSTAEVLEGIKGLVFPNGGYLIADRPGHIVCIEMAAGRTATRDVSGKAFGHANTVLFSELKEFAVPYTDISSDSRQSHVESILSEPGRCSSVESLQKDLRNHAGHPLSICRHNAPTDTWMTRAAFIADLGAGEIHIVIGNPCACAFKSYKT